MVLDTVRDRPDVVIVTSEQPVLRGSAGLRDFLRRYADGATTYSWEWDRRDVADLGVIACLIAEGTEVARNKDGEQRTPYRMTVVAQRLDEAWSLVHVHGSSPHA